MGRGQNTDISAAVAVRGARSALLTGRGISRYLDSNRKVTRDLSSLPRIEDIRQWKAQEDAWVAQAVEQARAHGTAAMRNPSQWAAHVADFGRFPEYGMPNRIWALHQIRAKQEAGVDISEDALVLSPTWWEALGRRVKQEYLKPNWKFENQPRRRAWGYDSRRDWSADFAIEQSQPFREWITIPEEVRDENGNVVLDEDGRPRVRLKRGPFGRIKGYGTFIAYHESATEGIDGGPPPPLPSPSWQGATGSDEDAHRLLMEVQSIANLERIRVVRTPASADVDTNTSSLSRERLMRRIEGPALARYDPDTRTLTIADSADRAEQAVAALEALLSHWDRPAPRGQNADIARHRQIQRLGRESALHAIAGLYGLQHTNPQFAGISTLADDSRGYDDLSRDVQRRVRALMEHMHPVMQAKARADARAALERRQRRRTTSRRARRARQRRAA